MSYFGFLFRFLMVPIAILWGIALWDRRQGHSVVDSLRSWPVWAAIALHVLIALVYTTPWDNYLVATEVWWYDPALVTGLTLGWVPIEEYAFFILQPILGGLWLAFLARRLPITNGSLPSSLRVWSPLVLSVVWLAMALMLVANIQANTYLTLELVWALPPLTVQLAFGADILWRYRRLVLLSIAPLTLYLSAADALAIAQGVWTIDPGQSLNILLGGVLPLEEFVFFLLTNSLITFGVVLVWARASHERLAAIRRRLLAQSRKRRPDPTA